MNPHSAAPAVAVRGLAKAFGRRVAVAGLDLDIPAGSFCGLVGPNGAGKTTSLRMMCGLLRPDRGGIWVEGVPVWADPTPVKARIGVLPEDHRMLDRLTGRELLSYGGLLRGMDRATAAGRGDELLDVFGLADVADQLVIDYSHGSRRKIGLASALLHNPAVLFLDEPFEAVDPISSRTITEVLGRFVASGRTIVFSSHVMATVERLCDRVAILHHGRLVANGPTAGVCAGRALEDVFAALVGAGALAEGSLGWLGSSSASS